MTLTKEQIARYSRQLVLPEIGVRGQQRLLESSALVIGAGGLGSPAALYLVAAGVGRVGILDDDTVIPSNLHRQVLHGTDSLGERKTDSAVRRLKALNPDITVQPLSDRLMPETAVETVRGFDVVLDGSDNFPTRYVANDACVLAGRPLVHGAVVRFQGQVMTIDPRRSACFRCVFPEPPEPGDVPGCQEAGILGAEAGIVGSLMAHEALKLLLGIGRPLWDRLLVFDGLSSGFRDVPLRRDRNCAVCGDAPRLTAPSPDGAACAASGPLAGA